jgi:hypothetical protein
MRSHHQPLFRLIVVFAASLLTASCAKKPPPHALPPPPAAMPDPASAAPEYPAPAPADSAIPADPPPDVGPLG